MRQHHSCKRVTGLLEQLRHSWVNTFALRQIQKPSRRMSFWMSAIVGVFFLTACSTSPTGRSQMTLMSDGQLNAMGAEQFEVLKNEQTVNDDQSVQNYVQCIADALLPMSASPDGWEVVVFEDDSPNAFALPGKKIGVHTGMLKVAKTPDQLASVIGHEIGHVEARHGNERVSTAMAAELGMTVVGAVLSSRDMANPNVLAAMGLGAQVGVILPFSRRHEVEADLIGLDLMAKAGFDPRGSVEVWENMQANASASPVEFMSTHPGHGTRIRILGENMQDALMTMEQARKSGHVPNCRTPQ